MDGQANPLPQQCSTQCMRLEDLCTFHPPDTFLSIGTACVQLQHAHVPWHGLMHTHRHTYNACTLTCM